MVDGTVLPWISVVLRSTGWELVDHFAHSKKFEAGRTNILPLSIGLVWFHRVRDPHTALKFNAGDSGRRAGQTVAGS